MKCKHILIFLILFFKYSAGAALPPFKIEQAREYELLNKFLKLSFAEEEYGYVIEGIKPISIRNFYYLAQIPFSMNIPYTESEILKSLLVFEAIPIIKKMNHYEKNFVLKVAPLSVLGSNNLGVEVLLINVPVLQKVIEENIALFKYILGPNVNSKELVNRIIFSEEGLADILFGNHVLTGIVLGFGSHNSVIGGRQEYISFLSLSKDIAPFASKSSVLPKNYAFHYLNAVGGDDALMSFRIDFAPLTPAPEFPTIHEEIATISQLQESLPVCLDKEPRFQFGAYKGESSNEKLFDDLKRSQKNIQKLLKQKKFFEIVLTKILGEKPIITCKQMESSSLDFYFFRGTLGANGWQHMLLEVSNTFKGEEKQRFLASFFNPSNEPVLPGIMSASGVTLKGLKMTLENLSISKKYFEHLSGDSSLSAIVENQLYYKTLVDGAGKSLSGHDRIRIGYSITDLNGTLLSANHDSWLSASQLIPGFSHGLKEMKIGEKREIYIHPSLAYGVLTTLPPCMGLIANVELLDVDEKHIKSLPPLSCIDYDWIENPSFLKEIEESIEKAPTFVGWFYRNLMNKIEGSDADNIVSALQKEEFLKQ